MHARCDAVFGNPVRLALERPARVYQQVHLQFSQGVGKARTLRICAYGLQWQVLGQGIKTRAITTCSDHFDTGGSGEVPADDRAKIAVATDYQNPE